VANQGTPVALRAVVVYNGVSLDTVTATSAHILAGQRSYVYSPHGTFFATLAPGQSATIALRVEYTNPNSYDQGFSFGDVAGGLLSNGATPYLKTYYL
jgi:hypothetical protein